MLLAIWPTWSRLQLAGPHPLHHHRSHGLGEPPLLITSLVEAAAVGSSTGPVVVPHAVLECLAAPPHCHAYTSWLLTNITRWLVCVHMVLVQCGRQHWAAYTYIHTCRSRGRAGGQERGGAGGEERGEERVQEVSGILAAD